MLATAVKSVVNQKIRLVEVYMESAANVEEDFFASLQLEKKEWLKQLRSKSSIKNFRLALLSVKITPKNFKKT